MVPSEAVTGHPEAPAPEGATRTVQVTVPATSANLGPGFDTLGLALSIYDTLTVSSFPDDRLEIEVTGSGAEEIPRDASNLVVRSIAHVFADAGRPLPGLRLHAANGVPHGRGLGSSGAAVTAGVLAAKGLLAGEVDLDDDTLLRLATELEGHPDNVAPALFGGLTIAWTGDRGPQHKKLLVHRGVAPLVLVPGFTMSTSLARSLQPHQVPREDAVFNVSRSALLVAALTQSPELLLDATADRLHQDYRGAAMPETLRLVQALRREGYAAVVSGAGPSVLVLADGPGRRRGAVEVADAAADTPWTAHMLAVDVRGGTVRDRAEGSTYLS
ncbi:MULTISPECIES: homoserine kinase [Microbacterium]|uniref:homoserine kinase n=1 Tax=Microbacterium TaxID=33882 RepID=UPI00217CCB57|nr:MULTISPECIES: homoserine kinase [Microbacterium]UWF78627.1 homoserine kinase [Microbacterium neungamense]WCM56798.1 homoserine kinase [Microbacterium sp. EF45047]